MLLFVLMGGLIGLVAGGFAGLVFGLLVGFGVGVFMLGLMRSRGLGLDPQGFLDSTFAVMGALCKADGRVSQDEIRVAETFFDKLALSKDQRKAARTAFNRGKSEGFDLHGEVLNLRASVRNNHALLQLFLQVQLSAVAADGMVHESEHRMLLRVARGLGLAEADVERLEAMLRHAAAGPGQSTEDSLADAYATLGVDPTASDAEIKKAYRRQMSRHHPDKLASRGMPESMRSVAEERTQEISKAYDEISQSRMAG